MEKLILTKSELKTVCNQCLKNVEGLLDGVSLLLDSEPTRKYALGLYMYALEEYGKAWILKVILEKEKPEGYTKPQAVFDYGSHNNKIDAGLKHLPRQCRLVSPYVEIAVNPFNETRTITLVTGEKVSVPASVTGLFQATSGPTKTMVESDYKTRCFYIDYDPIDNEEKNCLFGDKTTMKMNVELFRAEIEKLERSIPRI